MSLEEYLERVQPGRADHYIDRLGQKRPPFLVGRCHTRAICVIYWQLRQGWLECNGDKQVVVNKRDDVKPFKSARSGPGDCTGAMHSSNPFQSTHYEDVYCTSVPRGQKVS